MSTTNHTPSPDRIERDTRTALALISRGDHLRQRILDAHRRAWNSDTARHMIHVLDDMDLTALLVVTNSRQAQDHTAGWLYDLAMREQDRRDTTDTQEQAA